MFVDSHTHLLWLEVTPEVAVEEATKEGVSAVVNIGTEVEDSRKGAQLAAALPDVYSSVGIHPLNAGTYTAPDLEALAEKRRTNSCKSEMRSFALALEASTRWRACTEASMKSS